MYGQTETQMYQNKNNYLFYYDKLKLIAKNMFTWEGLDELGGSSRFLETALFEDGVACVVKDSTLGILSLRAIPSNYLNNYELPTTFQAYSLNYHKTYELNGDNAIYILNNFNETPTIHWAMYYARKLWNIDQTVDVNVRAQKTPVLIVGNKKQELTLRNLYMQYDGNLPAIFANKDNDVMNALQVLKTDAPFLADKLMQTKYEVFSEALSYLGLKNDVNPFKKERKISSEMDYNEELVNLMLYSFYQPRKNAVDEINKKFGTHIKLVINKKFIAELLEPVEEQMASSGRLPLMNGRSTNNEESGAE